MFCHIYHLKSGEVNISYEKKSILNNNERLWGNYGCSCDLFKERCSCNCFYQMNSDLINSYFIVSMPSLQHLEAFKIDALRECAIIIKKEKILSKFKIYLILNQICKKHLDEYSK